MAKNKKSDPFAMSWGLFLIVFLVICTSSFAIRALLLHDYFSTEKLGAHFFDYQLYNNILLWLHILLAIPPFLIGPFLFMPEFRKNNPWWHRQFGKIYVICCIASGVTGIILASVFTAPLARAGFCTLGTLWILTTYRSYSFARKKNFVQHRRWMLRSYSLTFAFVTVRFWAVFFITLLPHVDMQIQMSLRSWLAWVPNLMFANIYIAFTTHGGKFIGREKARQKIRNFVRRQRA